ncbi:MAG: DNA topoisomerase (ATP-hydrolyzing) subunit B [Candidatus Spechtbacterales bacterium]|nr:DNA topoisomerase (ATP-hydrolyzing) subunit B [Candidatus Spechtbacterales bacterium]
MAKKKQSGKKSTSSAKGGKKKSTSKKKTTPKKKAPAKKEGQYSAKDIYVLEGLDPVRKRPGMYIGSTGEDGLHHLIWEVVDNGLDEAMAGYADKITLTLMKDGKVKVEDDGRGIPVETHKQTKKSALETVMTTLHAGGKFGGESYKISGGLHGVGVSVVNALSTWLRAEVRRDGFVWSQEYKRGKPSHKIKKGAKRPKSDTGTTIIFEPDREIFKEGEFRWKKILDHLRQQAYLTKGVHIKIIDEREKLPRSHQFYFEGGLVSFVEHLNRGESPKHDNIFYVEKEQDDVFVEVALQYTDDIQSSEVGFANNIHTPEGGMHITGFRSALTRGLNSYAQKNNLVKDGQSFSGEDVREGITAIISVKLKEPQFEGQTKAKLGNTEARTVVEAVVSEALDDFLDKHPRDARAIIEKILLAAKARKAAKAARDTVIRKGAMSGLTLPGKLADCSSRKPEKSEIFIVEGDSAGGSAKQGRDRKFQAILPLRGKILNVERARLDKLLSNKEIKSLIIALGAAIAEEFDIEKLRYHKIVIMTDADVDGAHIRTLLLTLFFRYFREVVDQGYLYIAQPPLYKIQKGKTLEYAYTEADKEKILKKLLEDKKKKSAKNSSAKGKKKKEDEEEDLEEKAKKASGISLARYKGLGEMNPSQLWETTMNPENRVLYQVKVEDAEEADKIFDILMGKEVAPRKRFIQTHAQKVQNLDI